MRYALALWLWAGVCAEAAEPPPGPALSQLENAADTSPGPSFESAHAAQSQWSDGAPQQAPTAPISPVAEPQDAALQVQPRLYAAEDHGSSLPPSPAEEADDYTGFMKGFVTGSTAVEWLPNLIAKDVPAVGTPLGGLLGIVLLPVALLAGAVGGAISFIAGLF